MSLLLQLAAHDRVYEIPDEEAEALIRELRRRSELDTPSNPYVLACLSAATILSVAYEGEPMPGNVAFNESELCTLGTSIALLAERGEAGPTLQRLRLRMCRAGAT